MKKRIKRQEVNPLVLRRRIIGVVLAILRHVFLLGLCYVVLYPVLYMVSNAFKPVSQYYDPSVVWIPRSLTFDNFYIVFQVMDVLKVFLNTLLIEILPAFISTFIAMFVGYGLARFRFRGRGIILACVILTIIVPPQTIST